MTTQQTRLRKLRRIEEELVDLIGTLLPEPACRNCGAYKAADAFSESIYQELSAMTYRVQQLQSEAWAQEKETVA